MNEKAVALNRKIDVGLFFSAVFLTMSVFSIGILLAALAKLSGWTEYTVVAITIIVAINTFRHNRRIQKEVIEAHDELLELYKGRTG